MTKSSPATKKDIDDLSKMMVKAMTVIDRSQTDVGEIKDEVERVHLRLGRIERKLDGTIETVDQHSINIKKLKQKIA